MHIFMADTYVPPPPPPPPPAPRPAPTELTFFPSFSFFLRLAYAYIRTDGYGCGWAARVQDVRLLAVERRAPEAAHELDRARAGREGHDPRGLQGLPCVRRLVSPPPLSSCAGARCWSCDDGVLTLALRYAERGACSAATLLRDCVRRRPADVRRADRHPLPPRLPAARGPREVRTLRFAPGAWRLAFSCSCSCSCALSSPRR